jgi:hypothetical protein
MDKTRGDFSGMCLEISKERSPKREEEIKGRQTKGGCSKKVRSPSSRLVHPNSSHFTEREKKLQKLLVNFKIPSGP